VLEVARGLYDAAREHKRLAQRHRRAAIRAQETLERFCAENGIELELVTKSEEGQGHGEGEARD
jgi:hypothetical protein